MGTSIIVVSGLPRSGTSLMMQMLLRGGIEVLTDHVRAADVDNPRGYYELEKVKRIKQDASWLPAARGKAFKMVSQLLYELPATESYRIVFMERDLDEMLHSQQQMLKRRGEEGAAADQIKRAFALHLRRLHEWLSRQVHMKTLRVCYNDLLKQPYEQAQRVSTFLAGQPDVEKMVAAVDPALYRNRSEAAAPHPSWSNHAKERPHR